MAISEICKFEVKEEVDRYVSNDKIPRTEAHRRLADFFSEILGVNISYKTIESKDYRARKQITSNEGINQSSPKTPVKNTENNTNLPTGEKSNRGGKREGSGRKMTQRTAWKKAERLLESLTKHMKKNCEIQPEIDESIKVNIRAYVDLINTFNDEL